MNQRTVPILRWTFGVVALGAVVLAVAAAGRKALEVHRSSELHAQTKRLRAMYFAEDFERATSEGAQLIRRFPESSELRAWYILSMGRPVLGGREHAVEAARAMTTTHPSDPWGWLALAGALSQAPISDEALVASEKALTMMPHHPDFLWMRAWTLLVSVDRAGEVPPFVDAHLNDAKNQAELLVVKAQALEFLGTQVRHDDGKIAAAYAILDETRRIEPTNFHAHYLPGLYLYRSGEPEKGLELVKQAMALAPDSTMAHREYWRAFNALEPSRQSSERAAVLADLGSLEAKSSLHPWALTQIADQYGVLGLRDKQVELEERILKEYPEGQVARLVLHNRLKRLADAIDLYGIHKRQEARKPVGPLLGESEMESIDVLLKRELTDSLKRSLWDYVNQHDSQDDWLLENAYVALFFSAKDDPTVGGDKLLKIVRGMAAHPWGDLSTDVARGARVLADRGIALNEAETITRTRLSALERGFAAQKSSFRNEANYDNWHHEAMAEMHDALGWILFKQGRLAEAEKELTLAHRLGADLGNLYHLGWLTQARGDLKKAERLFGEGAALPSREENPCAEALREIYQQAHGDLRGYERHLAAEQEKGRALRRERLLTERIPQPERPPAFRLKGLAGDFVSSDDLVGKVAVVNFWGVWCSGCRQEMPYFQRLVDKYRHDPAVVVLSIDTYDALPILQKWIREKAYTFPVLLDDGLVYDARVESFPTTWFLDRRGRIAYIQIGSDQNLVEEFSWRIEDLKHR